MDEEVKVKHIPENFENGINIFGLNFRPLFLIEGAMLFLLSFIASFFLLKKWISLADIGKVIGICLILSSILLMLGLRGINGEPITTFIYNFIRFLKRRRIAFYNPRIKSEARPNLEVSDVYLPRDKILNFIRSNKEKFKADSKEEIYYDPNLMIFKDDYITLEKENEKKRRKKNS